MDEMNITSFLSSRPWSFFWWRWKMLFSHSVLQWFKFFTWRYYTPPTPHPPSVNNNETFNVTPSSNQATSSRIQHHPTHFTWCYYTHTHTHTPTPTHPHPPPPTPTHPHPPPPPISIQERPLWYSIKTEGSSKLRGTPSLEPIYIYIYTHILMLYYIRSIDLSIDLSICLSIYLSVY